MTTKRRVFAIVSKAEGNDIPSRVFDITVMSLILLSVLSIILESFESLAARFAPAFAGFELVTILFFTVEYAARLWTADLLLPGSSHPHIRYALSFMAIVDLLAILPFYLPFLSADLRFLRMLRLLRLLRMIRVFKLGRYFDALRIVVKVIKDSAAQLVISILLCLFVMLFSAIVMYTVENPAQPDQFPNIIASLWWAICTLTTVGYGDVYPITAIGRFFAAVISLVGIGIIAIPTGIIAAGFSSVISAAAPEEDPKPFCPYCGHRIDK